MIAYYIYIYVTGACLVPMAFLDHDETIIFACVLLWPLVVVRWFVRGLVGLWRL